MLLGVVCCLLLSLLFAVCFGVEFVASCVMLRVVCWLMLDVCRLVFVVER